MSDSLREFAALVHAFVVASLPGEEPEELTVRLRSGKVFVVPIVAPSPGVTASPSTNGSRAAAEFEPTDYQAEILVALEGRALRTDALAAQTSKDRRSLFTEGGLKGLIAAGWVRHDKRGYFRPDTPPE